MKNPPNIEAARVLEPGVIELVWSTGETLNVNLSDLPRRNAAFAKLADATFFAQMTRDDWGHGIGWPGGLDLGADRLYELSCPAAGLIRAGQLTSRGGACLSARLADSTSQFYWMAIFCIWPLPFLGSTSSSTPSSYLAVVLASSTVCGRVKARYCLP